MSRSRPVAPVVTGDDSYEGSPVRRLGKPMRKAVFAPFSLRQIVELVLLLPVNFIPWAGVPLFLIGTGYRAGPLLMWRYYTLREMTKKERKVFIRRRRWSYAWYDRMLPHTRKDMLTLRQVRDRTSCTATSTRAKHVLPAMHSSRRGIVRRR